MTSDAAMRTACTQRNDVGAPARQDRSSFQIATANRGQMTQVQMPSPMRNPAQRRVSTTPGSIAAAVGPAARPRPRVTCAGAVRG